MSHGWPDKDQRANKTGMRSRSQSKIDPQYVCASAFVCVRGHALEDGPS